MWRRGRNGANPGMVSPRGRGSDSRSMTHGRDALSSDNRYNRSRHGGDSSDDGSSGCKSSGGKRRARVGAAGRGGEDYRTLGWKLCPPHVFTMAGLDKEKRLRGWEKERFHK